MKIILKQSVPKLGKEGNVVNVKSGYARNFLFPNGMAIVADKTQIQALEKRNARLSAKLEETKVEAQSLAERINGQSVRIPAKSGEGGKLFGAITSQDITDAVAEQLGLTLEKKQVLMAHPIKRLGRTSVELDLHRMVDCRITVSVFDPEIGEEDEVEAVAEEAVEEEAGEPVEA
jgi:large subunit ribosomal protein L9